MPTIAAILTAAATLTDQQAAALFATDGASRYYAADAALQAIRDADLQAYPDGDGQPQEAGWRHLEDQAFAACRVTRPSDALPEWHALRHALLAAYAADLVEDREGTAAEPDPRCPQLWTRHAHAILTAPWRAIVSDVPVA